MGIVLPELAMLEMTKSEQRELTLNQSLKILANHRRRVVVSRATGACLAYELQHKRPVTGHLLQRKSTAFLREVLHTVATGERTAEYEQIVADEYGAIEDLRADYLSHEENKARALDLIDVTKLEMSAEFRRRVRSSIATDVEMLQFAKEKAPALFVGVLQERGWSREKAISFLRKKPLLLRYFYLNVWKCVQWERQGWLEALGPTKVSNELLDHQYVLAASFFGGLLSDEPAVNQARAALTAMLATRI